MYKLAIGGVLSWGFCEGGLGAPASRAVTPRARASMACPTRIRNQQPYAGVLHCGVGTPIQGHASIVITCACVYLSVLSELSELQHLERVQSGGVKT